MSKQRVAIITGAAGGIGAATARALSDAGLAVVIADWKGERAEEVARQLRDAGRQAISVEVDVSRRPSVEHMVEQTMAAFGQIDVLVNNAGINLPGQHPFFEISDSTWQQILDVNLTGMFLCSQIAGKVMAQRRSGSIINITSIGAIRPSPGGAPYHASKGGVISFSLALAVTLAPYHIRVNAIGPGYIATDMTGGLVDPESRARVLNRIPLDRVGQPEDIAGLVVYLASDAASFVSGQVIYVDGGAMALGIQRLPPLEEF